jgi:hypothetical protein
MALSVLVLVLLLLVALSIASYARRRIAATFFALSFLVAALVAVATHEGFPIVASWGVTVVLGLVLQTVKDTCAALLPGPPEDARERRRAARERARAQARRRARTSLRDVS